MANSGSYTKAFTSYDSLKFYWEIASQSVEDNSSVINWRLDLIAGEHGAIQSSVEKSCAVEVYGKKYNDYHVNINIGNNQTKTIASGTTTIYHATDGTKTFSFYFSLGVKITFNGTYIDTVTGSSTGELTPIPRNATITCGNGVVGEGVRIYIHKPKTSYLTTLEYRFINEAVKGDIAEKISADNYYWTIPTALYTSVFTRKKSAPCQLTCITYDASGTLIGSYTTDITVSVDEATNKPTIAPIVLDVNETTINLTGDEETLIKYHSHALYDFGEYARNGAFISSYALKNGDKNISRSENPIYNIENDTFEFYVVDSRGFKSDTVTITRNMIDYVHLTCNLEVSAPTTDGTLTLKFSGQAFGGFFGAASNNVVLSYTIKTNDGEPSAPITVINGVTVSGGKYSFEQEITGLNYQDTYTIQGFAADALESVSSAAHKVKTQPLFDWGKNDFAFNVPVSFQGATMNDFVIETGSQAMGSNGTWYWAKWNSGKAECWGVRNYGNTAVTTAWGNLYRSQTFAQGFPSGLFKTIPDFINISLMRGNYGGWIVFHEDAIPSATQTGGFIIARPAAATISQAFIGFHVIGRWKT